MMEMQLWVEKVEDISTKVNRKEVDDIDADGGIATADYLRDGFVTRH